MKGTEQPAARILKRITRPGRYTLTIKVPMKQGPPLPIPVHVVRGQKAGPTLVASAGEHGIEVNGIAAIDRVCREIEPRSLCGTLIGIPAINPANVTHRDFPEGRYGTSPWDSFRTWPGDIDGTPAERIAAILTRAVMNDADAIINIHAWSWYAASCVFTSSRNRQAVRLARAFGLGFVSFGFSGYCRGDDVPLDPKHNYLTHYALAHGKAAMLVELRTQYWLSPEGVADGMNGIRNVLQALGMLAGNPIRPKVQHEALDEELVHARRSGFFVPLKSIADRVQKNEVLGYLLDLKTGGASAVKSPCDGAVWLVSRADESGPTPLLSAMHAYANRGDMLALIKHVR